MTRIKLFGIRMAPISQYFLLKSYWTKSRNFVTVWTDKLEIEAIIAYQKDPAVFPHLEIIDRPDVSEYINDNTRPILKEMPFDPTVFESEGLVREQSLSFCVRNIVEGKMPIDQVESITPGFTSGLNDELIQSPTQLQRQIKRYKEIYWRKYPDEAEKVVNQLIEEKKLKNGWSKPLWSNWLFSPQEVPI